MDTALERFLQESSRIAENAMDTSLAQTEAEYPLLVMIGITEIEKEYLEKLHDFLNPKPVHANDVQLLVKLGDTMLLLGYVPMGLQTFISLNTLKERQVFIMPDEETLEPWDDAVSMQFICQDLQRENTL